jgi:hypothetical protein
MTTDIKKYLKLEDLQAIADFHKSTPRPEADYSDPLLKAYNDASNKVEEKHLTKPLMQFFKAKLKAAEFKPVPNSQGRLTRFIQYWNGLVTGEGLKDYEKKWAMENMEGMFSKMSLQRDIWDLTYYADDTPLPDVQAIYEKFTALMNAGNLPYHSIDQGMSCGKTGEYIAVDIQGWVPILGTVKTGGFKPVEPITVAETNKTTTVNFPTGDLVAMDWFRDSADGFTNYFNAKGDGDLPSVNSEAGVCKSTEFYAALGMAHVFVGNSSPNIFTRKKDSMIVAGSNWREYNADMSARYSDDEDDEGEDYDTATNSSPKGMKDQGTVCTDLWWVSIIDRQTLTELLVEQLGEDSREEIKEFVSSEFDVNIKVKPGKYTLHYNGHPSSFYELLGDKTEYGIGTPYFALTKDDE